ncbi:MAG: GTP-binding protein [Candidatus Rokubacteria bacterium]|nr:GTP-binding protein [Candidatus Rokubacteria bacterium]
MMQKFLSRVAPHRRILSIGLTVVIVALVGYGVLVSRAPRAMARQQPQMIASVVATPTASPPMAAESALATPGEPAMTAPPQPAVAPQPAEAAWPERVTGRVVDAQKQPLARVGVVNAGREIFTDADGTFALTKPTGSIVVKLSGYEKVTLTPRKEPLEVVLKPRAIKAAYLTYYGVLDRGIRTRVLDLVAKTELNAVVIDVQGDRSWLLYKSEVPMVAAVGAQGPAVYKEFDALMAELKARGIYTIARIVTFKDNVLATARPDLAVMDARTGKPWIDNEKLAWADPFREEVWDYKIALAKEAVRKGFDEVQFDYVRFPTDGKLSAAKYAKPNSKETRLPTIAAFLEKARKELGPTGAFVAADVFGYTAFNENDTDIGQRVEELAPHLDYFCPMVYPSGYHKGIPGYRNPVENPYQVVHESVRLTKKRSGTAPVKVRPWLQDFKDYAFDKRIFGVSEIRAQIKGSDDGGGTGWMLWNPRNDYTGAALQQKGTLAAK